MKKIMFLFAMCALMGCSPYMTELNKLDEAYKAGQIPTAQYYTARSQLLMAQQQWQANIDASMNQSAANMNANTAMLMQQQALIQQQNLAAQNVTLYRPQYNLLRPSYPTWTAQTKTVAPLVTPYNTATYTPNAYGKGGTIDYSNGSSSVWRPNTYGNGGMIYHSDGSQTQILSNH